MSSLCKSVNLLDEIERSVEHRNSRKQLNKLGNLDDQDSGVAALLPPKMFEQPSSSRDYFITIEQ
jgi:hypothetical protein